MERKLYPLDEGLMGALANAWARAILDGGAGFTEYFMAVRPAPQVRGVRERRGSLCGGAEGGKKSEVSCLSPKTGG